MKSTELMRMGELCRRLKVPARHARYLAEQQLLPSGVETTPERGNHRQLTSGQAFWLGLVLKLKESGIKAPLAAEITQFVKEGVRGLAQALNYDPGFRPFDGDLDTENQWFIDVGDLKYVRVVTDSCPSDDAVREYDWVEIRNRRAEKGVRPVVILRLDLAQLARLLRA